jgi:PKD repeat protein
LGAQPAATVTVPYDPARVDRPTVELFEAGSLVWSSVPAGTGTLALGNRTATVQVDAAGTFGVFADPPTVSGCREIGTAGRYEVTADISAGVGPGGACLEVNASDVTVDGNGRRLDGTDVGTAVRTVGATHTNVTVRNLTVRNWTAGLVLDGRRPAVRNVTARAVRAGIGVTGAERPVVTDVRVATVAGPVADTVGVEAGGARRPTLHNVTVRTRATAPGGVGVGLDDADRAAARSLTLIGPVTTTDRVDPVSRNLTVGLDGNRTNGTTLTDVTVDGHAVGLAAARADRLAVRQLDVSNATVGASVAPIDGRSPANRESGTITNSSVERVAGSVAVGGRRLPAAYVRLDGTNDVVGRDLRTPTATLAAFAGENVTLVPVGATPTAPASVPIGRVTLSRRGAGPAANVSFRYDQAAVNESTIAVYRVNDTAGNWSLVPRATVDPGPDTASLTTAGPDTYGAFAAANATANGSLPLGERLFPNGLPASSTGDPPTDVDGDGTLEDMDGDGRFGFTDVIEFVFSQQRGEYASLTTAQVDALDLDDNGRVTFVDVIDLVFELQGN